MIDYGRSLTGKESDLVNSIPSIEYQYLWKNYQFLLSLNRDIKILEIGAGVGYFTQFLLDNGFSAIDVVEIDKGFYLSQQRAFQDYGVRVFHDDAVHFLENSDEKYELIISRQVVEHLSSDALRIFFQKAYARLVVNGLLVSETINSQNFIYSHFLRYIDITHKCSFSTDLIKQIFHLISTNKNDQLFIGGIAQLNLLDYILDKLIPKKSGIIIHQNHSTSTEVIVNQKGNNLIYSFCSQIFRDMARLSSEWISLFFFYKRAYQNIGTEFIIFSIKKGEK